VLTNSRDLAEFFSKEHKIVLRDIAALQIGTGLYRSFSKRGTLTSLEILGAKKNNMGLIHRAQASPTGRTGLRGVSGPADLSGLRWKCELLCIGFLD